MADVYLLKFGGNAIGNREELDRLSKAIAELSGKGIRVVLVHGGGSEINAALEAKGIVPKKIAGLRITDDATMEVVEETLREINSSVVDSLSKAGMNAIGIPGHFVTTCEKKEPYTAIENGKEVMVDLRNVGEVVSTDVDTIEDLLSRGIIPVIYPVGADNEGRHLNINADTMASGIAAEMKCREMIQITDVPGILLDVNDPGSKQDLLTLEQVDELISDGTISGGMIPKVEACRKALNAGVSKVRMVNGKDPQSMILGILGTANCGTVITK